VPTAARVAKNESVFREVNNRIRDVADRLAFGDTGWQFICECSRVGCTQQLVLTLAQYGEVRASDRHFAIAPEHHEPEYERVVERRDHYWVVEKLGEAGLIAEEEAEA